MLQTTPKRDLVLVLLIAVAAHVGFFFVAAAAVASDLIKGKVEPKEKKEKQEAPVAAMQVVPEEEFFAVPEVVPEPEVPAPVPEEEKPEMVEKEEEKPEPAFVQTRDDQEAEKAPEDKSLIGERDTEATSEAEAEAGEEKMAALAGEEERRSDPKTFDSNFSKGDDRGAAQGLKDSPVAGRGDDQANQEASEGTMTDLNELTKPSPPVEEKPPASRPEKLPTIEDALAALEEEIARESERQEMTKPVRPERQPPKPTSAAREKQEASNQDGSFAPRSRKTRVAGVISARGAGSLDVAKTAVGRYQALVFKKLESAWQMENIRNRSLLAPGNITVYFIVNEGGDVSRQRQVARVGASGTQLGMILRSLEGIDIPKMPKEVVKELEGDPLEIIVTFNY